MTYKPTVQQQAFIDALTNSTAHLCLKARAGTGKTSSILMGVDAYVAANPGGEVIVCAYNKAIADEVKAKLYERGHTDWRQVSAATAHSLGFGLCKWLFKPEVDERKVRKLVDRAAEQSNSKSGDVYRYYGAQVVKLVALAKQAGFGFFPDCAIGDTPAWHRLADHFDVNGLDDTSEADTVVEAAQHIYRKSLDQTDVMDFDDMILFPLVKNLRVKFTKDLVIVDEAQDLSRARQALIRKFIGPRGRMVIVGDDRQAIYGFSGADAAALDNLVGSLGAEVLPLSVSWRCPQEVIKLAQTVVPDIEAAPSADEGEVTTMMSSQPLQGGELELVDEGAGMWSINHRSDSGNIMNVVGPVSRIDADSIVSTRHVNWFQFLPKPLGPDDAILCRNTAPLITMAYSLIRAGIPCKVEGRAIGEGLKALACRWKLKTIDKLMTRLEQYKERERQKALAKGNESKAEEVEDRVGTLLEICRGCLTQGKHGLDDVLAFIDGLFADGAENVTVLATYHRSKGREWPRVFLLEHSTRCPSRAARQAWQIGQEHNLAYVAFTRAQQSLIFVS